MIGRVKLWASNLHDLLRDRRLGVRTIGLIFPSDIGEGCFPYLALGYRNLDKLFATIDVRPGEDVLIDYGSGLGRVPIYAAQRPFKRVVGVELSKMLNDQAIENARAALPRLACPRVDMLQCDARAFAVPDDATIFYFFMPFDDTILGQVLDTIKSSLDAHPRAARIVYVKPKAGTTFLETAAASRPWIRMGPRSPLSRNLEFMHAEIGTAR